MSTNDSNRLLTSRDVATRLGFPSVGAFRAWEHRERRRTGRDPIDSVRVGVRSKRYEHHVVEAYIDANRGQGADTS